MKTALFKIALFFFLVILILAAGFTCELTDSRPKHDDAELEKRCDDFIQSLDALEITRDYSRAVQNLLSVDANKQILGLRTLSETNDLNAIPWIILLLDSDNGDVKVSAGFALERLVTSYSLQRRDEIYQDRVVLKPLGKNDVDLRPLAWIIQKMLSDPNANIQCYAATMAGYLGLADFEDALRQLLKSEHPAVVRSAQNALEMLKAGEDIKPTETVPSADEEYKVYSDTLLQLREGKPRIPKDVLVIRQDTKLEGDVKGDEAYDYLKKDFGELVDDDLLRDFFATNANSMELQDKFSRNLKIILLSKESEDEIFKPTDGSWKRFYSEYPDSSGIIELSRVAFNADKTKALLYYGSSFDSGKGGIGYYILLKKHDNKWVIQRKVICWIA